MIDETDVIVAVVAVSVAVGHLAVPHRVEPGGGQPALSALGLETHRNKLFFNKLKVLS